jgi:hypothetical protein
MKAQILAIILAIVIADCLMWIRALRAVRSLSLNPDGTAFTGRGRRWQVQTFTGRVASANSYTTVSGSSDNVSSTVHQTLLLVSGTGEQHNATLSGMGGIFAGQVVTHCWAASGRKQVTFAALNHTTRQQYVSREGLVSIARGSDVLLLVWVAVSWVSMAGIPQFIVFAAICYRRIWAFERSGTDALWAATAPIAAVTP